MTSVLCSKPVKTMGKPISVQTLLPLVVHNPPMWRCKPLQRDSRLLYLGSEDMVEKRTVLGWDAGGEHVYLLQSEEGNAWVLGELCKHVRK